GDLAAGRRVPGLDGLLRHTLTLSRFPDGGDALDGPGRVVEDEVLVGDDPQLAADGLEELARPEEELRPVRPAEALLAPGEGLVEQDAAAGHGPDEVGQHRTVEVVGDHDAGEGAFPERERRSGFEIAGGDLDAGVLSEVVEAAGVAVDGRHRMAAAEEETGVPPAPGRHVEHPPARRYQEGEPDDPGWRFAG